jgi:hypothetical protein
MKKHFKIYLINQNIFNDNIFSNLSLKSFLKSFLNYWNDFQYDIKIKNEESFIKVKQNLNNIFHFTFKTNIN